MKKPTKARSSREQFLRLQGVERKRFLRKCERLQLNPVTYDEAEKFFLCAYSVDEYQIGVAKEKTNPNLGNLYLNEEQYDKYYLEQ